MKLLLKLVITALFLCIYGSYAAGGVEFITCVKSIEEGFVHATAGLEKDDPECDLDYTKGEGVSMEVNCAISNSLGFGGHNATLLVKKFQG